MRNPRSWFVIGLPSYNKPLLWAIAGFFFLLPVCFYYNGSSVGPI